MPERKKQQSVPAGTKCDAIKKKNDCKTVTRCAAGKKCAKTDTCRKQLKEDCTSMAGCAWVIRNGCKRSAAAPKAAKKTVNKSVKKSAQRL